MPAERAIRLSTARYFRAPLTSWVTRSTPVVATGLPGVERERDNHEPEQVTQSLSPTTLERNEHSRLLFVGRSSVASRVSETVSPQLLTALSIEGASPSDYSLLRATPAFVGRYPMRRRCE